MYNVAKCSFELKHDIWDMYSKGKADVKDWPGRVYEYRIPPYLDGVLQPGWLGVVAKSDSPESRNVVRVLEIKNVLDGDFVGDYTFILGGFSDGPFIDLMKAEKRRKRIVHLLQEERRKIASAMSFDDLKQYSPSIAQLVDELHGLMGTSPKAGNAASGSSPVTDAPASTDDQSDGYSGQS